MKSLPDQLLNAEPRYELKLVCGPHLLPQARSWIRLHPEGFVVAYPPRRVNSVYLDTLHLSSFSENLAGTSQRQKLRLRWYGDNLVHVAQPLLERKRKRNLLGTKEQVVLPCELDLASPWVEILATIRETADGDWQIPLQTVDHPTLLTSYRREYYATPDGVVRVTLDYAQIAYDQRLSPRPNLRTRVPIADNAVIEIKASPGQEERLQEIAARFPVRRSRNSKYASSLLVALG
jgi:hypothetical protein